MNEDELKEYLSDLRNAGTDYNYIDGYRDGYESEILDDLGEYLNDLRNSGSDYEYIDGYKDGYEDCNGCQE